MASAHGPYATGLEPEPPEQPARGGLQKAQFHDGDIAGGTGSADVGKASSSAGQLPPAAAVGVQDDDHGDVEVDVAGGAGSGVSESDGDKIEPPGAGLPPPPPPPAQDDHDLAAADVGGGVGVENNDDHVDDSDSSADLSGDEDVEAGAVSSDSENDDKAAAEDWDGAGLGCGDADHGDDGELHLLGNLRAAARVVLLLGLGAGAAAALAFFATQPRYVYDLADQQHRSTRSTDDAFGDPDHKLVLQCGAGDMDLAVQRFCYPPGATATATPRAPHPLVVVTAEPLPSATRSAIASDDHPHVSSGAVDWVHHHHRGGTSTGTPPFTTLPWAPTPARLQSGRDTAAAEHRSRFLAYLFAFGVAMALVAIIQHTMLPR